MNKLRKNYRPPSDTSICTMCKIEKPFTEFGIRKSKGLLDLEGNKHKWICKPCEVKYNAKLHEKKPFHRLHLLAKRRAKEKNMVFSLKNVLKLHARARKPCKIRGPVRKMKWMVARSPVFYTVCGTLC